MLLMQYVKVKFKNAVFLYHVSLNIIWKIVVAY